MAMAIIYRWFSHQHLQLVRIFHCHVRCPKGRDAIALSHCYAQRQRPHELLVLLVFQWVGPGKPPRFILLRKNHGTTWDNHPSKFELKRMNIMFEGGFTFHASFFLSFFVIINIIIITSNNYYYKSNHY